MTKSLGSVLLAPGATKARRDLGPVAWVVAEALVSRATLDAEGSLMAATGIRTLANDLGLDKDTVARALTRLKAAGLVTRVDRAPAHYVIRSVPGLVAMDVLERPEEPLSKAVSRPTRGDSVSCPVSGDKIASEAELSTGSTKAASPGAQERAADTRHRIDVSQTNATSPHQQSLFPPPDADTNKNGQTQSFTALSGPATTNPFTASYHSATTTSWPTDSCHLAMAEGAGPAAPGRDVARKLGGSSHPTPSPKSEGERC